MEKIFCNKRLLVIAFFTVFSTASATIALANNTNHTVPVELKFIRWIKDQPLFQLKFAGNAQNDEFTIIIRDDNSNVLYLENINAENFTKTFLLNVDEVGDDDLQFEIISKKSNKSTVYEINRHSFLEKEMVTNELN
jgi:hypothetical protein